MVTSANLIASADEIDNRLGPIPGMSSDRIAIELRAAAEVIASIDLEAASDEWRARERQLLERIKEMLGYPHNFSRKHVIAEIDLAINILNGG